MSRSRNSLTKKRDDAKELIKLINKLPDDKKSEVLGIIRGYALYAETDRNEVAK